MKTYQIDAETAAQDFENMCDFMDVFIDVSDLSEEDLASYNKQKSNVIQAIRLKQLTVTSEGQPEYTTKKGEKLTIQEIDGSALLVMDTIKAGQDSRKLFKLIQELTKSNIKATDLSVRDIRTLGALVGLFLAM